MKVLIFFALVALAVASASVIGPLAGPIAVAPLGAHLAPAAVPALGLGGAAVIAGHGLAVHGLHG